MPTRTLAIKFPLEINEETGSFTVYNMSELTEVVNQNIKMILLTNPGERIFNNDFGVGLTRYLFLMRSQVINGVDGDSNYPPLREYILSQLKTYMPYVTVGNLEIFPSENLITVKFNYFINDSQTSSTFDLTIEDTSI